MTGLPPDAVGAASGTVNMLRQLGGVFGVAIAAAVFAASGGYASLAALSAGFSPPLGACAGLAPLGGLAGLGGELAELNTLRAAHGDQEFLAALDRAVAFSRWRSADVRSILTAGVGVPEPRRAGDALPPGLPAVPVRSLADYEIGGCP